MKRVVWILRVLLRWDIRAIFVTVIGVKNDIPHESQHEAFRGRDVQ